MRHPTRHADALDQVLELVVSLNADMEQSLTRDGLTTSRAHLMWALLHRGPSTQRALAEALQVSARNVTGLVDGLVDTGFVTREPHPDDRRATLVTFTRRGARVAKRLQAGQRQLAELLFGRMSDRRFAGFVAGLGDVLTTLRRELEADAQKRPS